MEARGHDRCKMHRRAAQRRLLSYLKGGRLKKGWEGEAEYQSPLSIGHQHATSLLTHLLGGTLKYMLYVKLKVKPSQTVLSTSQYISVARCPKMSQARDGLRTAVVSA